ncbi:MAG: ribonuclease P protein component [Candidatus Spechtbacterales bacterium]
MLKRSQRLGASEVSDVVRRGRAFHSEACMLRVLRLGGATRASGVAGVKVSKKASERNYQKRRVRNILIAALGELEPGFGLVLVLKPAVKEYEFSRLREEVEGLLKGISRIQ